MKYQTALARFRRFGLAQLMQARPSSKPEVTRAAAHVEAQALVGRESWKQPDSCFPTCARAAASLSAHAADEGLWITIRTRRRLCSTRQRTKSKC